MAELASPAERRAAGKDPTGRIRLRAFHQAGHIVIEIADDVGERDAHIVVEALHEMRLIGRGHDLYGAQREPGRLHVADYPADALVLGRGGVGANQQLLPV